VKSARARVAPLGVSPRWSFVRPFTTLSFVEQETRSKAGAGAGSAEDGGKTPGQGTMSRPLCILVVEDSEDDVALLLRELRKGGYEPNFLNVCTPEDMRAALREVEWDIVISDWSMPRFNGLDAFRLVKEQGLDIPFIIVSGTIGEEIAVDALKAGVHDFMTKGMFARLIPAVERELRDCQERRRRREAEIEVERRRNQIVDSERRLPAPEFHTGFLQNVNHNWFEFAQLVRG